MRERERIFSQQNTDLLDLLLEKLPESGGCVGGVWFGGCVMYAGGQLLTTVSLFTTTILSSTGATAGLFSSKFGGSTQHTPKACRPSSVKYVQVSY